MGNFLFIVGFFFAVPGIVYYLHPQRETYENKLRLFMFAMWVVHAILIVPWFLFGIYLGQQDFSLYTKIGEMWGALPPSDNQNYYSKMYDLLIFVYFYGIFYLSIYVGPILLLERKLGRKMDRTAYAVVVIWFWLTLSIFGQFITEMQSIARKLFPLGNDVLSQWILLGYIVLTTSASWLVRRLLTEYKEAVSKKATSKTAKK